MSFYDDASLVVIPSAQKTSKLYAVKPTDGSGDLTFTRTGDTATRVNSAGIIEKVRTNVALYSNDFSNAAWVKLANASVSATRVADPFGGNTAWQIIYDGTINGRIEQTVTSLINAGTYTTSFYARVASGTVSAFVNTTAVTITTTWQRFSSTETLTATTSYPRLICNSAATIEVYGAQLEVSDFGATPYIPTTTAAVSVGPVANVPRLDYLGSTCGKLLLEPQRTNLVTYSEQLDNASWIKLNGSVTANAAVSPDGFQNADKLVENTSNAQHGLRAVIASSINPFAFSVFAKSFSGNRYLQLRMANDISGSIVALFDLDNGTIVIDTTLYGGGYTASPSKIISFGNGWYRCTISGNKTDNVGNNNIEINLSSTTTPTEVFSYTGNGTSGAFVYGAQLEAGAYATSYIPTLGASATRGVDDATKTGITSLIGQTEGTLFLDFEGGVNDSANHFLGLSDGTTGNRIVIVRSGFNTLYAQIRVGGVEQAFIQTATLTANTRYKCAIAYKLNDIVFYVNGALVGTDTSATIPATSVFATNTGVSSSYFERAINQTLVFKTRLTNAQLAELTAL